MATFKKTNPDGKVVIAPIFLETIVMLLYFSKLCSAAAYILIRGGAGIHITAATLLLRSLLFLFSIHGLRKNYAQKHLLFSQLENFDLDAVECLSKSDRDFILAAIAELYGSHEAFTNYVRGSLRKELLGPMTSSALPAKYAFLIASTRISVALDISFSIWNAGAPPRVVLVFLVASVVLGAYLVNQTCLNLLILLCDRFAEPAVAHSLFASWLHEDCCMESNVSPTACSCRIAGGLLPDVLDLRHLSARRDAGRRFVASCFEGAMGTRAGQLDSRGFFRKCCHATC